VSESAPRVALYLRVSTAEQNHEPQRLELLEFCKKRGWGEPAEYVDQISGGKFTREALDKLMRAVRKRTVDVILCVKLDRLGRSLPHLAQLIAELDKHKVALICSSQGIDTSRDNPAGRLQMHVLMAVAEFERSLIRERTRAGLVAAKARGSKIGRPRVNAEVGTRIAELLAREPRPTVRAIAAELKIGSGTVSRLMAAAKADEARLSKKKRRTG
jgi:DNA invertase Pin-like site-specific DNA recombinase